MQITITCPTAKCSRCGEESPLAPTALRKIASQQMWLGNNVAVATAGFVAVDDDGVQWQVVASTLEPAGWGSGPSGKLCERCLSAWNEIATAFTDGSLPGRLPRLKLPKNQELPPVPVQETPPSALPLGTTHTVPPLVSPASIPPKIENHIFPSQVSKILPSHSIVQPNVQVTHTPIMVRADRPSNLNAPQPIPQPPTRMATTSPIPAPVPVERQIHHDAHQMARPETTSPVPVAAPRPTESTHQIFVEPAGQKILVTSPIPSLIREPQLMVETPVPSPAREPKLMESLEETKALPALASPITMPRVV